MLNKKVLLIAAACVLLSSCGQSNSSAPTSASPTKSQEKSSISSPAAAAPESTSNEKAKQATKGQADSKEESPGKDSAKVAEAEVKPLYHLNKAYNVVPNDKETNKKVVLLTFDDGPKEKEMIDGLIDTLDKHGAKAIFFVNGYRVKEHPELLKLIYDRGQIIGNHSWDHIDLKKQSAAKMRKQIEDVQKIVKDTTGEAPKFFRPPFGSGNDTTHQIAKDNELTYTTWSNGSLDWDKKSKNKPEAVIQNVLDQLHPGSNILMHELPWTVKALDDLLTKLEAKGYSFVDPLTIGPATETMVK
ncbi:polysaccharide deacetylase family protein [Paenibacillus puldeungensis]|uniref:Polysaccharide deacetylase family protein n=1 Tax=Paenibacillus puldeungensis TaxID=696536 RepID=A0ABW3RW05_9BACL